MRFGRTLAPLMLVLFGLTTALAQPKRGRFQKPEKEPAPKSNGAADKAADSRKADAVPTEAIAEPAAPEKPGVEPAPAAPAGGSADLGEPPTAVQPQDPGTKLSPLTPESAEFPSPGPRPAPVDFDRLLGDIAALRSRVAALTTTLFKSKLRVVVEARGADARIDALSVTLDDGVVFAAGERFSAEDERIVYEHAVAPGQHVIGLDVERYDARKREYRSWQSSKFALLVPESQLVEARFVLEDDSEMAADFPDDQDGEYDLRVRLRALVSE
jgi:hypothetical protein